MDWPGRNQFEAINKKINTNGERNTVHRVCRYCCCCRCRHRHRHHRYLFNHFTRKLRKKCVSFAIQIHLSFIEFYLFVVVVELNVMKMNLLSIIKIVISLWYCCCCCCFFWWKMLMKCCTRNEITESVKWMIWFNERMLLELKYFGFFPNYL